MTGPLIHPTDRVTRAQFLRLSMWFTLALCLVAALLPLPFGRPGVWSALGLAGLLTWETLAGGMAGMAVGAAVAMLIRHWRPLHVIAEQIYRLVVWETFMPADYVTIAFLAALGEELLFRGALQPLIGLIPMAVIFGLLHVTSVAHVILASLLGLGLGWLYEWSGSLWPPIAAHLAVDLVTGLILARTVGDGALPAQGD